jgi:hypothetical protein
VVNHKKEHKEFVFKATCVAGAGIVSLHTDHRDSLNGNKTLKQGGIRFLMLSNIIFGGKVYAFLTA